MKHTLAVLLLGLAWFVLPRVCAGEAADPGKQGKEHVEALIARLRSERFEEREAAMAELRALGPEAFPALKRLPLENDPELAWRVKLILQNTPATAEGEVSGIEEMIARFGRENGDIRLRLMRQIASKDAARGRQWLVSVLASENDRAVLGQAVEQLSWLGGGQAESRAIQAFYNKCGEELKGQVLYTLAGMDAEAARPLVREALKSKDGDLKTWAVRSAGRLNDRESAPLLRQVARGGDEVSVDLQTAGLDVLISFKDEALKEILPPLLKSDNEGLFTAALRGLGALRLPQMAPVLLELYNDPKRRGARTEVMTAMGALGDPSFVPVLREALARERSERYAAILALQTMRAKEAGADIAACLSDPNDSVRALAANTLGQLGYREGIPLLKKALADREMHVTLAAGVALLNLGDPAGEDKILSLAQDEVTQGFQIRGGGLGVQVQGALQMLGTYRIQKGIPLLKQLVAEGREEAIWPLIEICTDKETFRLALRQLLANRSDGSGRLADTQVALFFSQYHLYDRAAGVYEELAKQPSGHSLADRRLSSIYHEAGRYAEAEKAFERWSMTDDEDGTYFNNRAWFYCTSFSKEYLRPAQALGLARRAVAQRPDQHFIVDTYGWALFVSGQHEEALRELSRALAMIEPADRSAQASERTRIARVLDKLGRKDEALAFVRQALQDAPKEAELWYQAAGFFASTGRRDEAVDAVHRAVDLGYRNLASLKLNPEFEALRADPGFQYALRRAETEVRELEAAADELQKEARDAPPRPVKPNPLRRRLIQTNDGSQVILIE